MNGKIFTIFISLALASCGGINSFHEYARAGDTIAIPAGMQPDFDKDNITVTITPSSGPPIILAATDPKIVGIMNLYPDPVSNMLVSRAIGEDTTEFASTYANSTLVSANYDKDWFQTTVFLNLPSSLPTGTTMIEISNDADVTHSLSLDIIPGTGAPNTFAADLSSVGGPGFVQELSTEMFQSLARANHTTVNVASTGSIPHAVEITMSHLPDSTVGGAGKAFVINPLGYLKSLTWSDDGTNMKIILMQSKDGTINDMNDYKFYVAGTATGLISGTVKGYDINGNEITGLTSTLTPSNL